MRVRSPAPHSNTCNHTSGALETQDTNARFSLYLQAFHAIGRARRVSARAQRGHAAFPRSSLSRAHPGQRAASASSSLPARGSYAASRDAGKPGTLRIRTSPAGRRACRHAAADRDPHRVWPSAGGRGRKVIGVYSCSSSISSTADARTSPAPGFHSSPPNTASASLFAFTTLAQALPLTRRAGAPGCVATRTRKRAPSLDARASRSRSMVM